MSPNPGVGGGVPEPRQHPGRPLGGALRAGPSHRGTRLARLRLPPGGGTGGGTGSGPGPCLGIAMARDPAFVLRYLAEVEELAEDVLAARQQVRNGPVSSPANPSFCSPVAPAPPPPPLPASAGRPEPRLPLSRCRSWTWM